VASPTSDIPFSQNDPWLAPEPPDLVWFGGADATRFLNDIISQEIGDMVEGESRRSFLLEPQGKLSFLLWVIREGERWGLVTDPGRGEELTAALGRYRIRVDVDIELDTRGVWLVMGEAEGYDVSWPGVPRHLLVGDEPELRTGSVDEYESARVEAGEPAWGREVDEGTIPHESGLVPVSVDFTKGCFLGQELVARIDSRGGNTPRHLRRVVGQSPLTSGEMLTHDGKEVGNLTSVTGNVGLAMVRREVEPGDEVDAGGVRASIEELPAKASS
jgi:folate-binding protein YgfZ